MNLDDAARATRKYSVVPPILGNEYWRVIQHSDPTYTEVCFNSPYDSQAACDRMNLLAVLEAIRQPSDAMCAAGSQDHKDAWGGEAPIFEHSVYRAMIDALLTEVGK